MQTVKAKMKCSIINCISLGSILRVKIKRHMRQFEQPLVQKLTAKRPKLMPYKKSSSRTMQAGDVESQVR